MTQEKSSESLDINLTLATMPWEDFLSKYRSKLDLIKNSNDFVLK
jgi:hypothetical protein